MDITKDSTVKLTPITSDAAMGIGLTSGVIAPIMPAAMRLQPTPINHDLNHSKNTFTIIDSPVFCYDGSPDGDSRQGWC